jgi:hypothetical protein
MWTAEGHASNPFHQKGNMALSHLFNRCYLLAFKPFEGHGYYVGGSGVRWAGLSLSSGWGSGLGGGLLKAEQQHQMPPKRLLQTPMDQLQTICRCRAVQPCTGRRQGMCSDRVMAASWHANRSLLAVAAAAGGKPSHIVLWTPSAKRHYIVPLLVACVSHPWVGQA